MAKITSTPSRNDFIGNPIVYSVQSATAVVGSSFHRVKFRVPVKQNDVLKKEFILSQSIAGTAAETVNFDISSCFRAVADTYLSTLSPLAGGTSVTFAKFSAEPSAFDVYVLDNAEITTTEDRAAKITSHIGSYTDYERRKSSVNTTLSRKPGQTENVCPGDIIVYPLLDEENNSTQSVAYAVPETVSLGTTLNMPNGHSYYVVQKPQGSRLFQFVNSRGCIESIRAFGMNITKLNGESSSSVISRFERFNQFSRTIVRKHIKPTEIQMSSGPVTHEWAQWWAYEFCQATHIWMLDDNGVWLPCNVTIGENPTILDQTKTALLSVNFTVTPDLNGPLW